MVEYKVLITTSGIGSRLGRLTDFTNKSLVRIGDKPAISHIIEYYPKETNFVITLGCFGDYVKQFLLLTYPNKNFEFVEVDNYHGPGSSLGYSILQSKNKLQCPFIFHASDTIISNSFTPYDSTFNFCVGAFKKDSSQYATLLVNNNKITKINKKGEINFDYAYAGICGIKDYKLFWENLEQTYNSNPNNSSLFEGNIINKMLDFVDFKFLKTDKWFDMGNVTELKKTRKQFSSNIEVLDKKNESIYLFDDFVVKFFTNASITKNRVNRANLLKGLVPDMINSSKNFYKYKKSKGILFSKSVNEKSFSRFLEWADENLWISKQKSSFDSDCYSFYIEKSIKRIQSYLKHYSDPKYINGESVPTIDTLFKQIDIQNLCKGIPSQFHGDFILDNILETKNSFCLLDWRQDFANNLEIGDIYYDLAKLNHNLTINHNIVDRKLYNSSSNNCHILCNSTLLKCKDLLHKFIIKKGYDLKKVKILTSIIWLNMAPLHEYPFNKFLFNFGKYNLYKLLKDESAIS